MAEDQDALVQRAIYVPKSLLDEIDALLTKKNSRSAWIVDAMREKLAREASRSPQPARPGREEA